VRTSISRSARGIDDAAGAITPGRSRRGFTLIEVAVAVVIVSLALTALLVAVQSNTRVNDMGAKLTQAAFLAEEMREWTLLLARTDPNAVDDDNPFHYEGGPSQPYCPPRDGSGQAISSLAQWSQAVTLAYRDPNDLLSSPGGGGTSDVVNVIVDVRFQGQSILETSWLVAKRN
jgi:prepilin-type N-terminal cleavage/methylation domain-containing protein